MSKRILSLLLVLVMLVGCFASCDLFNNGIAGTLPGGNDDNENNNNDNTPPACEHTYTNACDTTCNKCNEVREIQHSYTNGCDTTCNVCNAVRTVAPCADTDGDDLCDICGANLACEHAWDNACDTECNKCGDVREAPHNYAGVCDDTCDDCGATRSAAEHNDTANGGFIDAVCDVCGFKLPITLATFKQAEYNTTTSTMPSNWNEFTYADNNDTQIMSYIGSSFFNYDYKFANDKKFNEDGSVNLAGIVKGAYTTNYSAATKLEDVTSSVDAKWGYSDVQKAEGGYAWKITLRNDLKWDDGTPITAADFVYSMQQQLDPAFMNFRANTYYDTLKIKNSRGYFFQNQEGTYETVESQGYAKNQDAIDAGETIYFNAWNMWGSKGYLDAEGNTCPEWLAYNDATVYEGLYEGQPDAINGVTLYQNYSTSYSEVGAGYGYDATIFLENTIRYVAWEDVGIYSIDSENAIVVCLDKPYTFLMDDGSLSLWAAYYFSSLPLVKKDLYESCKKAPETGATLWTSNYNSSLATTASWGPYKLVEFEAGSHYRLEKNPYWYGWNMPELQNQYNVTAINCRKVADFATNWQGFLSGIFDDASLATENIDDYKDSKYVTYSPGTGTFGMQLFSDLNVLKESENNNGILAIQEFRHALNLALNRSDIVEKIWPGTSTPCFGLVNSEYYYDIENSASLDDQGIYRNSAQAKAGILRAYGFVYDADTDTWATGSLDGLELEEAYEMLTGYNLDLAKEKMAAAIAELTANAEKYGYDATKNIVLVYGSSVDNPKQRERAKYLQDVINTLVEGTSLQGKVEVKFDASAGAKWADAFRSGDTQIGFGYGFSGNAFDPFDIIGAFVNPDDSLNYHQYWNTSNISMTLTMPEGDYAGAGQTITMSLQNWYFCLNGLAVDEKQPKDYNWDEGFAPTDVRLMILAALEEVVIKESRSIMLIGEFDGSLLAAKFSHFSEDYNTFMGFGGIQYMVVEYTDAEWTAFVNANNGDLSNEYKKSE